MNRALALIVCGIVASGCWRKAPRYVVERVVVSGETISDNALLGLSPEEIRARLTDALRAHGGFFFLPPDERPRDSDVPVRLELELAFTRAVEKTGRKGTFAEVGAALTLRRRLGDEGRRYELVGLGETPVPAEGEAARNAAVRKALELALTQAVASAHLQLSALSKKDEALVKDLAHQDPRIREFAIRVLSNRRHPAVAGPLLEKLKSKDVDEVRKAMGGLVELRERRAVPPLIELTRGQEPSFVREIVFALGQIGGEEAEAYLYTVSQGHDQEALRVAAEQSLGELMARKSKQSVSLDEGR